MVGHDQLTDDRTAIERLQGGDISGLEVLVRRYELRATRAAYLVVRDRATAEDVVSDAFVRCFERIRQFQASRPFAPWFLRIVVNDAIKASSRQERFVSLEGSNDGQTPLLDLVAASEAGPEEIAESAELRRTVESAIGRLSPAQRAAVVLHYYVGLSGPEMAVELASPLGTVKRRLHDARARLRQILGGDAGARSVGAGSEGLPGRPREG